MQRNLHRRVPSLGTRCNSGGLRREQRIKRKKRKKKRGKGQQRVYFSNDIQSSSEIFSKLCIQERKSRNFESDRFSLLAAIPSCIMCDCVFIVIKYLSRDDVLFIGHPLISTTENFLSTYKERVQNSRRWKQDI